MVRMVRMVYCGWVVSSRTFRADPMTAITATARAAVLAFAASQFRCGYVNMATRLCCRADRAGLAWGLLPRRLRREHARYLHRTREFNTSWPEQWAVTRDNGRASIMG